ncbi:hypothetical protein V3C99_000524 [Haemonchus contortus]
MPRLVVFVGIFALSLPSVIKAAAPGRSAQATVRGKRDDGQAQVSVVTCLDFDASTSFSYLQTVRSTVEQLEESHNVFYDPKLIHVKAENIDGKFAAVYTIQGVNCDKLDNFISAIKGLPSLTKQVTVTCGGKTKTLA